MKKLFLLVLMSLGFTSTSIAEVTIPPYVDATTMATLCSANLDCWEDDTDWVKKYYVHKQFPKAFAVGYTKKSSGRYYLEYIVASGNNQPSLAAAKNQALKACQKDKGPNETCAILFVNNSVFDKELYKSFMTKKLPANAKASGSSFMCNTGYPSKESHFCWIVQ